MESLPDDTFQHVASFLPSIDTTRLISTCKSFYSRFDKSEVFWTRLIKQHCPDVCIDTVCRVASSAKKAFLVHTSAHEVSSVRWIPLLAQRSMPSSREGHLCARVGQWMVVTGGFTDDDGVYLCNIARPSREFHRVLPSVAVPKKSTTSSPHNRNHTRPPSPQAQRPVFAYGATLTALDQERAIRFGGFRSGGYSNETGQVALLTISEEGTATWQVMPCRLQSKKCPMNRDWIFRLARAYHTATLLFDRYLLILGGMQSHHSVWDPIVLDTHTWTWLDEDFPEQSRHEPGAAGADGATVTHPTPRHGHSVVVDVARNRLVLFGGGNGSDLLRSGNDNTEIWECKLPQKESDLSRGIVSEWNCILEDQTRMETGDTAMATEPSEEDRNRLSATEALNLGRCHASFRVTRDKVLLLFGSGRPATNGILVFDLARSTFLRPSMKGVLPMPRFTFASLYIPEHACIVVHGGYCTQHGTSIDDAFILDLAGRLNRTCGVLLEDTRRSSKTPITSRDIAAGIGLDDYRSSVGGRHVSSLLEILQLFRGRPGGMSDESDDDASNDSDYEDAEMVSDGEADNDVTGGDSDYVDSDMLS